MLGADWAEVATLILREAGLGRGLPSVSELSVSMVSGKHLCFSVVVEK